ncbi:MAG: hypothetical protein ACUVQ5_06570 [Candidatus Methanomethylicaceae archaeon]
MTTKEIKLKRKFLAAQKNLAEKINELAKKSGRTVFSVVNEALGAFIKASELGKDLTTIMDDAKILEIAKNSGMVLVPEGLHETLMELNSRDAKMDDYWKSSGIVFGKYLDVNGIREYKKIERTLKEVIGGNPDLSISEKRVVCISPRFSESRTEGVATFLEGVMSAMGFKVDSKEISRGIIIIKFKTEANSDA